MDPITGILLGTFYGGQAALYGYLKDNELPLSWSVILTKAFWEKFDPIKALKTVLLGMVLGGLGVFSILNIENKYLDPTATLIVVNFASSALTMGVDQLIKFIVRRTPLVKAWNWLKGKMGFTPLQ